MCTKVELPLGILIVENQETIYLNSLHLGNDIPTFTPCIKLLLALQLTAGGEPVGEYPKRRKQNVVSNL